MSAPTEDIEPGHPAPSPYPALVAGYAVWLAATVLAAALAPGDVWEAMADYWLLAFLAGAVACFATLLVRSAGDRSGAPHSIVGFGAYALPVSLLVVGWQALSRAFGFPGPDPAFQAAAPIAMLLASGGGLLYGWRRARERRRDFLVGAVLPPAVMAAAALGYFAFGTFTSDAFRYRDAFAFGVLEAAVEGEDIKAECVFTLRKPGDYAYVVSPLTDNAGDETHPGEIVWKRGDPTEPGDYPLTLIWRGVRPGGLPGASATGFQGSSAPYFGVNRRDGGGERIVRTFYVPIGTGGSPLE